MSVPPYQDPGDPSNPNSLFWQQQHGADGVNKRSPNTPGDFLLTGVILGVFLTLIILNLLIM